MNIQPIIINNYQYQIHDYCSKPSFSGLLGKTKTIGSCNIGKMPDGIIGKVRVKNAANKDVFLDVIKHVEYMGFEEYAIQDKKGNILGEIEFKPTITKEAKHVWVEHLASHGSRHHRYRDEELESFRGIGTRLMQIALKRGKESGCEGNIELFSTNGAIEFYKKIGLKDYLSKFSRYQQHRMYLPEEGKEILSNIYGGL